MNRSECERWLKSIVCTVPFTLDDARELYKIVKAHVPDAFVDVYTTRGDQVHVRVDDLRVDLPIV